MHVCLPILHSYNANHLLASYMNLLFFVSSSPACSYASQADSHVMTDDVKMSLGRSASFHGGHASSAAATVFPSSSSSSSSNQGTVGQNDQKSRRNFWATRSSVRSHRSLVRWLRTARFATALRCAHLFACSFTSLTPTLVGKLISDVSK